MPRFMFVIARPEDRQRVLHGLARPQDGVLPAIGARQRAKARVFAHNGRLGHAITQRIAADPTGSAPANRVY